MAVKAMTTDWGYEELTPVISKFISDGNKAQPSVYKQFITDTTTDNFFVKRSRTGGFGDFPMLDEGDVMNYSLPDTGDSVVIQPERRQLAFAITFIDKKFNNMNKVQRYSESLRGAAMRTIEKVAVLPLNLGFDSGYPYVDGQPLFSLSHVRLNGTITANTPSSQVDLTMAALEAAYTSFIGTVGEDGTVINNIPRYLVVSTANAVNAARLLNSVNYYTGSGSGTNPPNAADTGVYNFIKGLNLIPVVDPYLTDPDAWFLLADKSMNSYEMVWNEQLTPRGFDDNQTQDSVYSLAFSCMAALSTDLYVYGSSGS